MYRQLSPSRGPEQTLLALVRKEYVVSIFVSSNWRTIVAAGPLVILDSGGPERLGVIVAADPPVNQLD